MTMRQRFTWDPAKAASNLRKHGISFEEAVCVFADPMAVTRQDRVENGEQRWQTIGAVGGFTLLLVAHTLWDDEAGIEVVRIISARRADRKERRIYENG